MTALHAVSLFSGIEGFALGLEQAGIPTLASVEIDPAARGVIADRLPGIALFNDVREVEHVDFLDLGFIPEQGIITAGFPCQDLSVAGRRAGLKGYRSGLFFEVVRIARNLRPRWLILENVPGLLSSHGGSDMGAVLGSLAELGYGLAWRVLDAQFFGVPQRRRRVIIVGHLGDPARAGEVLLEPEGGGRHLASGRATGQVIAALTANGIGAGTGADDNTAQAGHLIPVEAYQCHGNNIGPMGTLRAGNGGLTGGVPFVPTTVSTLQSLDGRRGYRIDAEAAAGGHLVPVAATAVTARYGKGADSDCTQTLVAQGVRGEVAHALTSEGADASEDGTGRGTPVVTSSVGVRRLTPLECERLMGLPDGWTRTSNGKEQADSPRYRQLGNAVAVPVVAWVAKRLATTHNREATQP